MTSPRSKPLVIDVDGSLLRTDMLFESFLAAIGTDAPRALKIAWNTRKDRPRMKSELASLSQIQVDRLPVNPEVLALAKAAQSEGREVVLASGSDKKLVQALANRLGIKGEHLGSEPGLNLTGKNKAVALVERFGKNGFHYVGDSDVDLSVWECSSAAIAVAPSARVRVKLEALGMPVTYVGKGWSARNLVKALRPHQWIKNVLLLLPLFAVHRLDFHGFERVLLAIVAFSLAASSIYIVNDLLDLDADRQHERKHLRPFAAGSVPIQVGMVTSLLLGITALTLASIIDWKMLGLVAIYMSLSLAYSVYLKRQRWIDIWVLAILYTLRVVAGAVAGSVAASGWLIAFVFPVFMALGCVKRMTEVARAKHDKRLPGRAYAKGDRGDLLNMSVLSAFNADIIFLAYTYSETAYLLYAGIWELRWVVIPVSAWMYRMIWTGWAGKQNYDPIVFAMRDRVGLSLAIVSVLGLYNAAALAGV